jgi:hypothetical protein
MLANISIGAIFIRRLTKVSTGRSLKGRTLTPSFGGSIPAAPTMTRLIEPLSSKLKIDVSRRSRLKKVAEAAAAISRISFQIPFERAKYSLSL